MRWTRRSRKAAGSWRMALPAAPRRLAFALLLVAAGSVGCTQRMRPPEFGWVPGEGAAREFAHGAAVSLALRGAASSVQGELIVIGADSIHVLTSRGLAGIPLRRIARSWLRLGGGGDPGRLLRNFHKPAGFTETRVPLAAFARFPAGWPRGFDRSSLSAEPGAP